MNSSTALSTLNHQLSTAAASRPDWYILVSAIPGQLKFATKRGDELVSQHDAATFAEIRGYEIRAGIWHVTVDGPDTPALRQAIALYGWREGPSLSALAALRSSPAPLVPRAA